MLQRRELLAAAAAVPAAMLLGKTAAAQDDRPPQLDAKMVNEFVGKSHFDLETVRTLAGKEPMLVHASWDWGNGDWETGLGAAAHTGRREIAEFLLESGARIDAFAVAMLGLTDILQPLLNAFPKLHSVPGPHQIPLLSHAVVGRDQADEAFYQLLERGADVNAASRLGMTPLMMAASVGRVPVLRALLERGADPAAKDSKGKTALDWATERQHDQAIEVLKGAS